jgi:hypothetical protein
LPPPQPPPPSAISSFGALGGAAVSALHAQSNAPYYEVAEINVNDQAAGNAPANRYLIIRYPSKAAAEKHWNESVSKWWDSEGHKYATFRAIGVEGVEAK